MKKDTLHFLILLQILILFSQSSIAKDFDDLSPADKKKLDQLKRKKQLNEDADNDPEYQKWLQTMKDSEEKKEQYESFLNTQKGIKPEDIVKVLIMYDYQKADKHITREAQDKSFSLALKGIKNDLNFFRKIMPFVSQSVEIADSTHPNFGGKEVIKSKIINAIAGKKIAIVFYSGHMFKTGRILIPTHTDRCRTYFRYLWNLRTKNSSNFITPGPNINPNFTFQMFCYPRVQKMNIMCEDLKLLDDWYKSKCDFLTYTMSHEFIKSIFAKTKLALFLDSCFSGSYKEHMGDPLNYLVHSSAIFQQSYVISSTYLEMNLLSDGLGSGGGYLTMELKLRLKKENACFLDGKGKFGKKDGVLTISEWTHDIAKTNWQTEQIKVQHIGTSSSEDIQLLNIPIKILSINDCNKITGNQINYFGFKKKIRSGYKHASRTSDLQNIVEVSDIALTHHIQKLFHEKNSRPKLHLSNNTRKKNELLK